MYGILAAFICGGAVAAALKLGANLALGYALLQDGQSQAAKGPLQRVRLTGPFSNKALLGTGWADAEVENYRRALVPWMELRGRDLLDPAVQESMLAIPYAMSQLDSISQEFGREVEERLNAELVAGYPTEILYLPRGVALEDPDLIRTKVNLIPEHVEKIRVVDIQGLDMQADGGTHVANTREVGAVRIVGYKSKGKINKRLQIALADALE